MACKWKKMLGPLYFQATIDPRAHLTLIGKINSLTIRPLVGSGAIGVFMHLDFAHKCQAII